MSLFLFVFVLYDCMMLLCCLYGEIKTYMYVGPVCIMCICDKWRRCWYIVFHPPCQHFWSCHWRWVRYRRGDGRVSASSTRYRHRYTQCVCQQLNSSCRSFISTSTLSAATNFDSAQTQFATPSCQCWSNHVRLTCKRDTRNDFFESNYLLRYTKILVYMRWSDVIYVVVITRRHLGGILNTNKDGVKQAKFWKYLLQS